MTAGALVMGVRNLASIYRQTMTSRIDNRREYDYRSYGDRIRRLHEFLVKSWKCDGTVQQF